MKIQIRDEQHRAELVAFRDQLKARLAQGGYSSPDEYYGDKDRLMDISAALRGTTAMRDNPMGFWFGRMSN
jgi:hypothetical protein